MPNEFELSGGKVDHIGKLVSEHGLTRTEVARRAGLRVERLYVKADAKHMPTPTTLDAIASAIGCSPKQVEVAYGRTLGYPQHAPQVETVIVLMNSAPVAIRNVIVQIVTAVVDAYQAGRSEIDDAQRVVDGVAGP